MSITETGEYTQVDTSAAINASAAVVRCLPAADLVPADAAIGAEALNSAIPGAGAKAVTANLAGAVTGTIVLCLSVDLAAQVENGPVGPQELVAGLEPALTDATAALAETFGEVRFEAAQALDAEVALANGAAYESVVIVPIAGAGELVASFVLLVNHPAAVEEVASAAAAFEPLSGAIESGAVRAVELLNDVEMGVTAELGRTRMTVRELLSMQPGSIVELDRAAGSPVDLLVNGTLVARGEVVVIDEEFGVRITEIIGYDQKKNG